MEKSLKRSKILFKIFSGNYFIFAWCIPRVFLDSRFSMLTQVCPLALPFGTPWVYSVGLKLKFCRGFAENEPKLSFVIWLLMTLNCIKWSSSLRLLSKKKNGVKAWRQFHVEKGSEDVFKFKKKIYWPDPRVASLIKSSEVWKRNIFSPNKVYTYLVLLCFSDFNYTLWGYNRWKARVKCF